MSVVRCSSCNMPSTSGTLWVVGRIMKCGSCLRTEVRELKRRINSARRTLLTDYAPHVRIAQALWALRKPSAK